MCSDDCIRGRATFTTVLSSMIMNSPTETAPSVHHFLFSGVTNRCTIEISPSRLTLAGAKLAAANRPLLRWLIEWRPMADVVWQPDGATLEHANATRLVRRAGVADYDALVRRSVEEPSWFWPLVVEDLGLEFSQPWTDVFDDSRGPEWTTWFVGGKLSIAHNCAHRWAQSAPERVAAVGLGEDGSRRELTYAELSRDVTRLAEQLVSLGVGVGDRVAIFLPMSP